MIEWEFLSAGSATYAAEGSRVTHGRDDEG
jgi:hypothetical protein